MAGTARHFKEGKPGMASTRVWTPLTKCAAILLLFSLAEGTFLILSQPAIRIVLLVIASLLSVILLWLWNHRNAGNLEVFEQLTTRVFPLVLFVMGVCYLLFFPPGTVPDEGHHYGCSYEYANLFDPRFTTLEMRREDVEFVTDDVLFSTEARTAFWRAQNVGFSLFATASDETIIDENAIRVLKMPAAIDIRGNPPQVKILSALGILFGRLLNLSGVVTFYLSRFFNFLWAFALIVLAVRLTPVGKNIMMTVSLLPMSLHLLGSCSYDAGIIGYSLLLIALLLRLILNEDGASKKTLIWCIAIGALLAPCKTVYYCICLLSFAVPAERFSSRKREVIWKSCMLAIPLMVLMLFGLSSFIALSGIGASSNAESVRLDETGRFFTLSDIVAHPMDSLLLFLRTLFFYSDFYASTMVGGTLGWFQPNIVARNNQVFALLFALALSTVVDEGDGTVLSQKSRILSLGCAMLGALGIVASMWLGWTFVTEDYINGVQGRYLIPFLPLFLLAIRSGTIRASTSLGQILVMFMMSFNFLYLAQTMYFVIIR